MKMKQVRKYSYYKPALKAIVSKDNKSIKLSCGHRVRTNGNTWDIFRVGDVMDCNECSFNERNSRPKPIKGGG